MAQASTVTYGYWNTRSGIRGQINRMILKHAGVDFTEKRYEKSTGEWETDKTALGLDFPNLPYIIDGDVKLTESKAVTVYICDKFAPQLLGKTPETRARIIMCQ